VSSKDGEQFVISKDTASQDSTGSILSSIPTAVADLDIGKDPVNTPSSHPPVDEAHNDFYGLPSNPLSIYHTGPAWPLPTGPDAQRIPKEARPVCDHAIAAVWCKLGEEIYRFFDSVYLKWTSMDFVRFAERGKEPGPPFIWVGVVPQTLSRSDAESAAMRCKGILNNYDISDVEIAFRESAVTWFAFFFF
jgi:hypothetical protein